MGERGGVCPAAKSSGTTLRARGNPPAGVWGRGRPPPPVKTPGGGPLARGEPFPAIAPEIVAPDGTILPSGQAGELALGGPQLSLGYLADEALTAKRFPTLFHPRLGYTRWFLTGHPASRDEAGLFHSP